MHIQILPPQHNLKMIWARLAKIILFKFDLFIFALSSECLILMNTISLYKIIEQEYLPKERTFTHVIPF